MSYYHGSATATVTDTALTKWEIYELVARFLQAAGYYLDEEDKEFLLRE